MLLQLRRSDLRGRKRRVNLTRIKREFDNQSRGESIEILSSAELGSGIRNGGFEFETPEFANFVVQVFYCVTGAIMEKIQRNKRSLML